MARKNAAERDEALTSLRVALAKCGPDGGSSLEIRYVGGGSSPTGRSDYYELRVWSVIEGRPQSRVWLTRMAAVALGLRFNKAREALLMTGCGYSKSSELADDLARVAGHPIFCVAPGAFGGPSGLVGRRENPNF